MKSKEEMNEIMDKLSGDNIVKVYSLEWHNAKNFSSKYLGEDLDEAKRLYEECNSKLGFDTCMIMEIIYIGIKPIFNKSHLIDVLSGHDYMPNLMSRCLQCKSIL